MKLDFFVMVNLLTQTVGMAICVAAARMKFTKQNTRGNATAFSYCISWDAENDGATPVAALTNIGHLTDFYDNDSTIIGEASATVTLLQIPTNPSPGFSQC